MKLKVITIRWHQGIVFRNFPILITRERAITTSFYMSVTTAEGKKARALNKQ
jgi:hypothetical protein